MGLCCAHQEKHPWLWLLPRELEQHSLLHQFLHTQRISSIVFNSTTVIVHVKCHASIYVMNVMRVVNVYECIY